MVTDEVESDVTDSEITAKFEEIQQALKLKSVEALKQAAISENGLLTNDIRQFAWPLLCGMSSDGEDLLADKEFFDHLDESTHFTKHPDWSVIVADVHRSVMWFDESQDADELKTKLTQVLMAVLLSDPELCYFQGFNVVCAVILRVMSNDAFAAFRLAKSITRIHFRHLMLDRKGERMWDFLSYIFPIIGKVNMPLRRFLESADLRENVCISWILTWLGYHIGSITLEEICRLFDFFLAMGDRYMPVYFSAALILLHADGITSCQPEMTEVFQYVKSIPESIPFQQVIKDATELNKSVPLESVELEARELIKMRNEQQQLLRQSVARRRPDSLAGYSRFWQLGYSLYRNPQMRTIAASTFALGVAYLYTRNPDALTGLFRLLRRCANTATVNIVGIDIDLLLG